LVVVIDQEYRYYMDTLLLSCRPIGVIRTEMRAKFDAPHQPDSSAAQRSVIELFPNEGFELALTDLAGFERIWLIWWFHRNSNWRPMVRPPRGKTHRRGVFATRSPHRPNPIGITSVPLLGIRGRELIVGSNDLLDNTPILDIKPYISEVDSFPHQRNGWLAELGEEEAMDGQFRVLLSPIAQEQHRWLATQSGLDFMPRVIAILAKSPFPSRRHRITRSKDGLFRLSCGVWRVFFSLVELDVTIERIAPGFPLELLQREGREIIPDYQAQLAFEQRWPSLP
jgi:tRNA-Thr(GGU) m(6)t(6)A37 methyltransferase TsaA